MQFWHDVLCHCASIAFGWGDPHYNTFDNIVTGSRFARTNYYNFQGDGRFVLVRIVDAGGVNVFELQSEMRGSGVTVGQIVAFGDPTGAAFQV